MELKTITDTLSESLSALGWVEGFTLFVAIDDGSTFVRMGGSAEYQDAASGFKELLDAHAKRLFTRDH